MPEYKCSHLVMFPPISGVIFIESLLGRADLPMALARRSGGLWSVWSLPFRVAYRCIRPALSVGARSAAFRAPPGAARFAVARCALRIPKLFVGSRPLSVTYSGVDVVFVLLCPRSVSASCRGLLCLSPSVVASSCAAARAATHSAFRALARHACEMKRTRPRV